MKWQILGDALCGADWSSTRWHEFRTLIHLRNELVHFKADEYEIVIPPPSKPHRIIARLPKLVEIRNIPQAWPQRVLTPSLAVWAVDVATSLIADFRSGYKAYRLETLSKTE